MEEVYVAPGDRARAGDDASVAIPDSGSDSDHDPEAPMISYVSADCEDDEGDAVPIASGLRMPIDFESKARESPVHAVPKVAAPDLAKPKTAPDFILPLRELDF